MREENVGMIRLLLIVVCALCLNACDLMDDTPDYRYRLTVEVDTPDGVKTGSSVIEVDTAAVRSASSPASQAVSFKIRGEAVTVDLPNGRTLFALLRSPSDVQGAARVMLQLAPKYSGEPFLQQFDNIKELRGPITLPRTFPAQAHLEERSAYPLLVTFGDITDSTGVVEVDPDNLSSSLGKGMSLRRITVELTEDPVSWALGERLPWLSEYPEPSLDPGHGPEDFSLPATLRHSDFRQGY